jgi:threonine/homoserine/homoserine lactone efflux protein
VATPLDGRQAAVRPAPGVPRGDLVGVRRGDLAGDSPGGRRSLAREAWRTGFLTNLLNPKIGVFYTSVLPQLVPTGLPVAATQAGLVLTHAGLSLLWLNGWARALARSRTALRRLGVRRAVERVGGVVLVGLGVGTAVRAR